MNGIQSTRQARAAEALERQWRAMGFVDGAPPHVAPALVTADVRSYRIMRCGRCGRRGQKVKPMHRGHEYRLLCRCNHCGHGEEA